MSNLFKKVAAFTDIHHGCRHNSAVFNQDCIDFVDWFCKEAKERGAETCIFLGDWHHNRNTINVSTLNYTIRNLKKLSESFEKVYIITGNHDLYFREKREIHSLPMGNDLGNVQVIDEHLYEGDVAIVPWLVGEEWKDLKARKEKYIFGHFEIPGFKMNAQVVMPDHGEINKTMFKNQDYVFSGHFHIRQSGQNVHYIGNPFGHNYSDTDDVDRGAMFLEWGGDPEYVNYTDGPRFITRNLSDIKKDPSKHLAKKMYVRAHLDDSISYEEANHLKDTYLEEYGIRELKLVATRDTEHKDDNDTDINCESVDQIILEQLADIESEKFNSNKLLEIYNQL